MPNESDLVHDRNAPAPPTVGAPGQQRQAHSDPSNPPPADDQAERLADAIALPAAASWPNSRFGRAAIVAASVCCLLVVAFHLLMVCLWNAPHNIASEQYQRPLRAWINPLFSQNWKLFAPDPWSANTRMKVQARVARPDGSIVESAWVDLTAEDLAKIQGNPIPSRVSINSVFKGMEYYFATAGNASDDPASRPYTAIVEKYLLRIATHRLGAQFDGGRMVSIRIELATTPIPAPPWVGIVDRGEPSSVTLGWWKVTPDDF